MKEEAKMAPYTSAVIEAFTDSEPKISPSPVKIQDPVPQKYRIQLVWRNVIFFSLLHSFALYGFFLLITQAKWATVIFSYLMFHYTGFGITGGAHRLWSHKCYKAKWPLRLLLVILNTMAFQDSVIDWSRDHRLHHKHTDTDADPYNSRRGFFFSHIGWLLCRKHPEVKEKGKTIDLSDLYADPILAFQKKYYFFLMPLLCFVLPTYTPVHFWGETWKTAFYANMFRYALLLNATWLVNSAAHIYGYRPYDESIHPRENVLVNVCTHGEGFHNYHHVFPWDYKAGEFGDFTVNCSAFYIDMFAKIGLVYDRRVAKKEIINNRVLRTGDGSYQYM